MLNDMRRKLGQKLQQLAVPRLESALVQYPYRSAARDPSAAILAQPLAVDADRSIADVKELAVSATPLLSPNALSLIADCEGHQLLHPCKWPY